MDDPRNTDSVIAKPKRKRVCLPRGLRLNSARDLPLLRLIRDTTYITRHQIHALATSAGITEDDKNLNRRLRRLAADRLVSTAKPWAPFPGTIYSITQGGLLALEKDGDAVESIGSSSENVGTPNQIGHFLMLDRIRIVFRGWRNTFSLLNWSTDRQIKAWNIVEQQSVRNGLVRAQDTRRYAKDYDGVADLVRVEPGGDSDEQQSGEKIVIGIEYERVLKNFDAYERITAALNKENKLSAVLYFADSVLDCRKLIAVIRPERLPVAFVTVANFCHADGPFDARVCARGKQRWTMVRVFARRLPLVCAVSARPAHHTLSLADARRVGRLFGPPRMT